MANLPSSAAKWNMAAMGPDAAWVKVMAAGQTLEV